MLYTLITGSTSGIGKELAYQYANKGHSLILVARRDEILQNLKSELEAKFNCLIAYYVCDLNDLSKVNEVFAKINSKYAINCLINNAGIGIFENINDLSIETINQQINLNVISPVLITKLLIDNIGQNKGSVINICSLLSYLPNAGASIYVGTKHALYGFSNSLRLEYPDIHVLTVHPATVKTNFFKNEQYLEKQKYVINPELVAKKTYHAYRKHKRKLNIPKSICLVNGLYQVIPTFVDKLNRKYFSNK